MEFNFHNAPGAIIRHQGLDTLTARRSYLLDMQKWLADEIDAETFKWKKTRTNVIPTDLAELKKHYRAVNLELRILQRRLNKSAPK